MSYIVRDEKGIMLMEISNDAAQHIIRGAKGRFLDYKTIDGTKTVAFEILEDSTLGRDNWIKIFLWRGTKLIPAAD